MTEIHSTEAVYAWVHFGPGVPQQEGIEMTYKETKYYDADDETLRELLIGQTVVSINGDTMTLKDGTKLLFEDTSDCCAWFAVELEKGNLTDNAITDIRYEARTAINKNPPEKYTLHILAADTTIADVQVEGDPSSGYYCQSFNVVVTR